MRKATKVIMTAVVLVFVAAIATSAFGFGWGRGPACGYGRGDVAGCAGVDLTAEQKTKLEQLHYAEFKETEPLREQMFAKRDEVRRLWLATTPDKAKIIAAEKEMRAIRDQLHDKMTAFRLDALNVLTPEQREKQKYTAACQGVRHERGSRHEHGGGHGAYGGGCPGGGPGAGGCR